MICPSVHGHAIVNGTVYTEEEIARGDANDVVFILTSSFLIFTMQSGYALLESGIVSRKNEVNILVKNATNVLVGGFSYWAFGFGLSFGKTYSNLFIAVGSFFITANIDEMGVIYSKFVFEHPSWLDVERQWVLGYPGSSGRRWFGNRPFGRRVLWSGAAALLGPRTGRYDKGTQLLPLGNPTNALLGLFMLWWGWLGFSAGSTTGIVDDKWKYSSRASVTTILASSGGGLIGMLFRVMRVASRHFGPRSSDENTRFVPPTSPQRDDFRCIIKCSCVLKYHF
ncbi:putative ammonium transporter 3 [Trichonephila inaurata madagascariensis]|uniref:Putative ammonium transporter 3 n=1 Tax=Trichonephila inaurata madagascariensis TaxID=2747483 RepID=A0A8X6MCX2_9ARAC|nr:putative ammonium transporter 3 [Trichonephila inaurata madagascariensis]